MLSSANREQTRQRRAELARRIGSGVVLLRGTRTPRRNFQSYELDFRQSSHLLYYTGIAVPESAALFDLDEGSFRLFVSEMGPDDLVWHDREPSRAELGAASGADSVHAPEELDEQLAALLAAERRVHVLTADELPGVAPSEELIEAIIAMRLIKSAAEIARMKEAMVVTAKAHVLAMGVSRPGIMEQEVQAVVEAVFRAAGHHAAYPPIATCRGEVLHANKPHRRLEDGQLFLLDAGAEQGNSYTTDITRTWPVNGRFSEVQARLYDTVLNAQLRAIEACRPGTNYGAVHERASREIIAGLKDLGLLRGDEDDIYQRDAHALFFPHGVGHLIGLDVHDLEDLGEDRFGYADGYSRQRDKLGRRYLRLNRKLEAGYVVTIEPGLYFIRAYLEDPELEQRFADVVDFEKARSLLDFGGIRIEDNIYVGAEGPEVLSHAIPKERDQVEACVGTQAALLDSLRVAV